MISREALQSISPLAELPPDQIDAIAARAADLSVEPGEYLLQEGEQAAFFFLLRGKVTALKTFGGVKREVNTLTPPVSFGEVPLLLGAPAIADLRVDEPSRVARREVEDFHELILSSPRLSDQLFST